MSQTGRQRALATIKIAEFTDADPDAVREADDPIADYEFDPEHFDPDAEHGFYLHRARKDALGLDWLEYLNGESPRLPGTDADAVADAVREAVDGGKPGDLESVEAAIDDLRSDVRESAYQGAREAIEGAR